MLCMFMCLSVVQVYVPMLCRFIHGFIKTCVCFQDDKKKKGRVNKSIHGYIKTFVCVLRMTRRRRGIY